MATRGRRPLARGRGRRPGGTWSRTVSVALSTTAAASKTLLTSFSLSTAGIGETVRRTRGRVWFGSDQSSTTEAYSGAFGLVVVNDIALAAGAASIPGPNTDRDDDGWFVWEGVANETILKDATGIQQPALSMIEFDSKGMRRIEEGFSVAMMFENASASTGIVSMISLSLYSTRH